MKRAIAVALGAGLTGLGLFLAIDVARPGELYVNGRPGSSRQAAGSPAQRLAEALARSARAKGVYMTSAVANDTGRPATKLRNDILELLDTTELNAVVIDVKEARGGAIFTPNLTRLIEELHRREVWVIAREAVFKDTSQERAHPEWYLTRSDGGIWRDRRGDAWLDPASRDVWTYEIGVAAQASAAGFDEVQFDYIRFPSDGDVAAIRYPVYDGARPKYEVLRDFFAFARREFARHRPELILSADLFGYAAIQTSDLGIGQRLQDIGDSFDYVSLMVYPSHYYAGFEVPADPARNLAAVFYPYAAADASTVAPSHPYDVVYRSLLAAEDTLATTSAPTPASAGANRSPSAVLTHAFPVRRARLRPWLQDFDLGADTRRGIYYGAAQVRAQIDAAEDAGASGWLLWSPDNVYTRAALKPKIQPKELDSGQ